MAAYRAVIWYPTRLEDLCEGFKVVLDRGFCPISLYESVGVAAKVGQSLPTAARELHHRVKAWWVDVAPEFLGNSMVWSRFKRRLLERSQAEWGTRTPITYCLGGYQRHGSLYLLLILICAIYMRTRTELRDGLTLAAWRPLRSGRSSQGPSRCGKAHQEVKSTTSRPLRRLTPTPPNACWIHRARASNAAGFRSKLD